MELAEIDLVRSARFVIRHGRGERFQLVTPFDLGRQVRRSHLDRFPAYFDNALLVKYKSIATQCYDTLAKQNGVVLSVWL